MSALVPGQADSRLRPPARPAPTRPAGPTCLAGPASSAGARLPRRPRPHPPDPALTRLAADVLHVGFGVPYAVSTPLFALGTAAGDFTATTLHIGYLPSVAVFAALICIPAAAYAAGRWSPVLCFWFAYVLTRPLGASVADGFGKPSSVGGLGFGDGPVAAVLVVLLACVVAYLAVTRIDVHPRARHAQSEARRRGGTA